MYDDISAKIVKHIAKDISKSLTHIFNLTFLHGVIPEDLKKALVKLHQFLKVGMKLELKTTDQYLFPPASPIQIIRKVNA